MWNHAFMASIDQVKDHCSIAIDMLVNELKTHFQDCKLMNDLGIMYNYKCILMLIPFSPFILVSLIDIIMNHRTWNLHCCKFQNFWMLTSWTCICACLSLLHEYASNKAMVKPFDTNAMTKLWIVINKNVLLTQRLSVWNHLK
jgi:hypothetical protein